MERNATMTISDLVTGIRADERAHVAIAHLAEHPEKLEDIARGLCETVVAETWPDAEYAGIELIYDLCVVALATLKIYRVRVRRLGDAVIPLVPPPLPRAGVLVLAADSQAGMLQSVGWYHGSAGLRVLSQGHNGLMASAPWPCKLDGTEPEMAHLASLAARALVCAAGQLSLPS